MPARHTPGRFRRGGAASGFSLIELMVGVAILGVLLAVALPSFTDWIRNNQLRVAAETLREGLQLARSEAVKRNTRVRLQFVSSLDSSCSLNLGGPYWLVNAGSAVTPAGNCGAALSLTTAPALIQASPVTASAARVTLVASASVVAFDASGRQTSTLNPTTAPGLLRVDFSLPSAGTCVAAGGSVRCLRVVVTTAGEVRMCDPAQTAVANPTRCY